MEKIEREIIISQLYDLRKNDAEIAREIKACTETVRQWRIKHNLPVNFDYSNTRKIDVNVLKQLVEQGYDDNEIAKQFRVSSDGVYGARMRNNISRPSFAISKLVEATQHQREILIGTLLGDSSLRKESINPGFKCAHGLKLKDYCYSKFLELESLGMKFKYEKRLTPDQRNGIYYEDYLILSVNNPYYLDLYDMLYSTGKKIINPLLFKDFTAVSLAYMFMDDGQKSSTSISICTNCFTKEELLIFIDFLKHEFNLHFNIQKNNVIYLSTKDLKKFISIIFPYLHETMYYKIGLTKI